MSQENDRWKTEILVDELAAMRLQKLDQQRRLFEKKQRRKRQEPLMVQANPDASLRLRRLQRPEKCLLGDSGLGNPFLQKNVPEAHLRCGAHSVLGTVSCGGDGCGEHGRLMLPTEADSSDSELEEVWVEDVFISPPPEKEPRGTRRRGWSANQGPGASVEEENKSQDVADECEVPYLEPNPGMDGDLGPGNSHQVEDLEEKKEELEFTEMNALATTNQETSKALEGFVDIGSSNVDSLTYLAPSFPCLQRSEDMEAYVLQPVIRGITLQCRISRDKHGLEKTMFPSYYLYMEAGNGRKHFLLAGRKRKRSKTSNYVISVDPTDLSRDGYNFVGKVRSNVLGTKFTIFNNGVNPSRKNFFQDTAQIRQELGVVCYETNVFGLRGPRKMTVIIPAVDSQNQRIIFQPLNEQESLMSRFQRGSTQGLVLLQNKTPLWCEESSAYVLNFSGRVTRASVKNFQIVHPEDPRYLLLQFGRVAPDTFTMDFCYPLCPLQAFAICLSSLDGKLACE
ncbi:tubby-related protein 2 [Nycticebus coucang]|uniref:tubby-related protein 2 n=1 Tax=Nycticebus coucang TaxID=9470 RepID=UPI00234DB9DA|nr:tubby-related protein 2 [Nycticebus coucang]